MKFHHSIRSTFFLLLTLTTLPLHASDEWPQFRGPDGNGITDAAGLPAQWSEKQNVVWKTPIHGKAWSSPVVLGKQVWLTTATEDGRALSAICVDRDNGKILQDLKLFEVPAPQYAHPFNSYGSPTPVIEPGRVYVTFGSPGTACLDTTTGKKLWERRDFVCNHFRGAGSSPIVYHDLLIMNFDGSDFQFVVALNKNTGETVWKTDRSLDYKDLTPQGKPMADGDFRKAFSTPRVAVFDSKPVLISIGGKAGYGYDPDTGKELWRIENRESHSGSNTPIYDAARMYLVSGIAKSELWAVRPGGSGVVTDTHVDWKIKKNVPGKPSMILADGLIYMVDDGGIVRCVEAKNGEEVWHGRLNGKFSASILYAPNDKHLYFFNDAGQATVLEAGREMKVVATNVLDDGFMASPAVAGKSLFLRTKTALYRIEASAAN
jgi:outer membrane protein assembly factor BamB